MNKRELFVQAVRGHIGRPYLWGGQTNSGYACSGLVVACLQTAGEAITDTTAQGLFNRYKGSTELQISQAGQLVFYGSSPASVTHVMVVLDVWKKGKGVLAGARGGKASTKTIDDAWLQSAFVDVVLSNYWDSNRVAICDPWR